ncbi:urease accessory protein UreD [Jatrophihabitans telluris]|uniref:Urease accessory protein UreD n=1 Tax=Jatrophihabitans telluris TaxID=2038343 RepID=A0ABY4QXT7_9ACTN|nr:urease accessory protein UreD [Jatrophihabitans telluris]UQX88325.1 urease accessory protein UreD [Jatrophihabitans telluris]
MATVEKGGVLRELVSGPPLTVRRIQDAEPDVCSLCLVGSAAGPLAGDEVEFRLSLGDGARVRLSASGASIAQGDGTGTARQRSVIRLGDGAELIAEPPPLIVAAGGAADVEVCIELADSASMLWSETLVLGRSGEAAGLARLRWSVRRDGAPLLVQSIDLRDPSPWVGVLDGQRVLSSAVMTGPGVLARTVVDSPRAVAQRVDDCTVLFTVLSTDAATAAASMAELRAAVPLPVSG